MQKYFGRRLVGGVGEVWSGKKPKPCPKDTARGPVMHPFVQSGLWKSEGIGEGDERNDAFTLAHRATSRPDLNNPAMSATIEKKQAAKDLPVQGTSEKREILENYFQKKILGKQEHEFIPGVKTAAEAALRPKKGKVL